MIIAVDFDGTLCEHKFPEIGKEVPHSFAVLRELQAEGHQLILWTMRNDGRPTGDVEVLSQAVDWCRERGIEFFAVNENPTQSSWSQSPKTYAHIYIDDAALGCPLRKSSEVEDRKMVNWKRARKMLVSLGALPADKL